MSNLHLANSEQQGSRAPLYVQRPERFSSAIALQVDILLQKFCLETDKNRIQYITYTHVPLGAVVTLFTEVPSVITGARFSYDRHSKILVLKVIPDESYWAAMGGFGFFLEKALSDTGYQQKLVRSGPGAIVDLETAMVETDNSWGPDYCPATLVVEIGLSESAAHLASRANMLLHHETTGWAVPLLVVTIEINRDRPQLVIKPWEGNTSMNSTQSITISRVEGLPVITEGPSQLIIPFSLLLTDDRVSPEHDIIFTTEYLSILAYGVWAGMVFP